MTIPDVHRVMVTGASGFVGRFVCERLARAGYAVRATGRTSIRPAQVSEACEWLQVDELGPDTDWSLALENVDAVVHLAARVHQLGEQGMKSVEAYRRINTDGTVQLARMAAGTGVRRLVFLSSIKVNGEHTTRNDDGSWKRFTERDAPSPQDAYGASKWKAEQGLFQIAQREGISVTVLRPPLVYGPGVGANFLRLIHAVARGFPLPFGRVQNLRSLIYVENLADAIVTCLERDLSRNRIYLVRDTDLSTPALIRALAGALGRSPRLLDIPTWLLMGVGILTGRKTTVARLLDSLVIDDGLIRSELRWTPPIDTQEGLARTAAWYRLYQTAES